MEKTMGYVESREKMIKILKNSSRHRDTPVSNRVLPVEGLLIGDEEEVVQNRFGGDSVTLPPDAVAVYDFIIGSELVGNHHNVIKGCDWFRKYFPSAYMVLLD
tara:strand:- start:818 stop:1126 length:309 start_codon:yes stop_codon:yes gene_type:complete